jgi:large subunit ribosomal protein L31
VKKAIMKKDIHPTYYSDAKIVCACGNVIKTGSIVKEMKVEICSACHPFYTGKKKIMDTTGRVDRFKKLAEKAVAKKESMRESGSRGKDKSIEKAGKKAKK